jgi:diguanylate cyclase (GGDEF)-like protein
MSRGSVPGWPQVVLGRVRLTVCCHVALLDPARPVAYRALGGAAIVVLLAEFVVTCRRGRPWPGDWWILGVATFTVGAALRDPMATAPLATAVVATQSLYGSSRVAWWRLLAVSLALPAVLAVDQGVGGHSHNVARWGGVVGLIPVLAMVTIAVRGLYNLFERHVGAAEREAVLARTGSRLIDQTDPAMVARVVREGSTALCALTPGVCLLILDRDGPFLHVVGARGLPESMTETRVSIVEPADPTAPVVWLPEYSEQLNRILGERRHWRTMTLSRTASHELIAVGGRQPVPDDIFDGFCTISHQHTLAEANSRSHAQLIRLAHHDRLTGLATRALLMEHIDAANAAGDLAAVLIIDLDDFKQVNDTHGHDAGDQLLVAVAERLRIVAGEHGRCARLGGDEFALALAAPADPEQVAGHLSRWLWDLTTAAHASGASIGIAPADPTLAAADLLRCADTAMYVAKNTGKNRVERYATARHGDIIHLRLIEQSLPGAAARGEIVVFYQPHVDLGTGRCVGAEALVRWQHPVLGLLPPDRFIPLAERTGHISDMGAYALRVACVQTVEWSALPDCDDLRMAVNVAAAQLYNPEFVDLVADALASSGLPPGKLVLELTESGAIDHSRAREQIQALVDLGVQISVDDFGTGYASLATLHTVTAHQVKIDRSFVSGDRRDRGARMVELIVAAARILDLDVVAEGVETEEQAMALHRAGVPVAQGYLYGRPMPAGEFPGWLARHAITHQAL